MTFLRLLFGLTGTAAFMAAASAIVWPQLYSVTYFGGSVAVCALSVLGIGLVAHLQAERRRERDKARHPASWLRNSAYDDFWAAERARFDTIKRKDWR